MVHDLSGEYVLLSENFIYYGEAKDLCLEKDIIKGRNHRKLIGSEIPKDILSQLDEMRGKNKKEIRGKPICSNKKFSIGNKTYC